MGLQVNIISKLILIGKKLILLDPKLSDLNVNRSQNWTELVNVAKF